MSGAKSQQRYMVQRMSALLHMNLHVWISEALWRIRYCVHVEWIEYQIVQLTDGHDEFVIFARRVNFQSHTVSNIDHARFSSQEQINDHHHHHQHHHNHHQHHHHNHHHHHYHHHHHHHHLLKFHNTFFGLCWHKDVKVDLWKKWNLTFESFESSVEGGSEGGVAVLAMWHLTWWPGLKYISGQIQIQIQKNTNTEETMQHFTWWPGLKYTAVQSAVHIV